MASWIVSDILQNKRARTKTTICEKFPQNQTIARHFRRGEISTSDSEYLYINM